MHASCVFCVFFGIFFCFEVPCYAPPPQSRTKLLVWKANFQKSLSILFAIFCRFFSGIPPAGSGVGVALPRTIEICTSGVNLKMQETSLTWKLIDKMQWKRSHQRKHLCNQPFENASVNASSFCIRDVPLYSLALPNNRRPSPFEYFCCVCQVAQHPVLVSHTLFRSPNHPTIRSCTHAYIQSPFLG